MSNLQDLLERAIKTSVEAGIKTLTYYQKEFDVSIKSDNSPLTQADLDSNTIIESALLETGIPILSEEGDVEDYSVRKAWTKLWIVDPLDGTKEFVKKSDEYTINVALVENNIPVLGVVYAPAKDLLFYGLENYGAFKVEGCSEYSIQELLDDQIRHKLPAASNRENIIVVASKSHRNAETNTFLDALQTKAEKFDVQSFGSSLKLCMVADGSAHIYPRLGPTMEWDTAAGHAVVLAAACKIYQYPSFLPLEYNKENLLNPWFIVYTPEDEILVRVRL